MLWILLILLIYGAGFGAVFFMVRRKYGAVDRQLLANLNAAKEEEQLRRGVLEELAKIALGLVPQSEVDNLLARKEQVEETIRAEKGRITITEAELEAVDVRLRELEEIKRELEVSNMDAVKELEMLRAQERDLSGKNEALRAQIGSAVEQVELLMDQLKDSADTVERLTSIKNELAECETKCTYYQEQITEVNMNYMALKKAYDALDIEYAQLYEKQQMSASKAEEEA